MCELTGFVEEVEVLFAEPRFVSAERRERELVVPAGVFDPVEDMVELGL